MHYSGKRETYANDAAFRLILPCSTRSAVLYIFSDDFRDQRRNKIPMPARTIPLGIARIRANTRNGTNESPRDQTSEESNNRGCAIRGGRGGEGGGAVSNSRPVN